MSHNTFNLDVLGYTFISYTDATTYDRKQPFYKNHRAQVLKDKNRVATTLHTMKI